jgi:transmembrane sensor
LDAQTSLLIEEGPNERRVRLADGEAYFVVAKDRTRPFTVETPTGSVRVTGTTFDVRTVPSAVLEVTVVEGAVRVRPGEIGGAGAPEPVALGGGQSLSAGPAGVTVRTLSRDALEDALAWRDGWVVFDNVPLGEAIARFARYHGRGITATPAAAKIRVGGRYSLDDLDKFFADIQQYFPIRVDRGLSDTVRVGLRSER